MLDASENMSILSDTYGTVSNEASLLQLVLLGLLELRSSYTRKAA